MKKKPIEFIGIRVTKSIREAISDAANLTQQSEKDFIHQALADSIAGVLLRKGELVQLSGESVDEDLKIIRYWWDKQKKGDIVFLQGFGNSEKIRVSAKAMEIFAEETKNESGESVDYHNQISNSFDLFFNNIKHENKCAAIKYDKWKGMLDGTIPLKSVEEEEEKFREIKGYLRSEVPSVFVSHVLSMITVTPDWVWSGERILKLGRKIEDDDCSLVDLMEYYTAYLEKKELLKIFLGKSKAKALFKKAKLLLSEEFQS